MYLVLHHRWVKSLGMLYLFSSKHWGELPAQMLCVLEDRWSMFDRLFFFCRSQDIDCLQIPMAEEERKRGVQFISGDTERTASEQCWVKRASHGYIKRRWKSPKLNSQLSFEKLVGIIRGFSGKCDNGNLDWIIVEISAPFGRQMSRKTSGDPIEVERLPLVFCPIIAERTFAEKP